MDTTHAASRSASVSWHHVRVGALLGVVAAIVMGMFAMIASATYHDTGFFTPLHHIASALIGPTAMMRSMEAGMAGDTFAISLGPALLGLGLHLATGAFWGAIFGLIVSTGWLLGVTWLVAGIVYGLAVMLVMPSSHCPSSRPSSEAATRSRICLGSLGGARSRSSTRCTARCSGCGRCSGVPSSVRGVPTSSPGYDRRDHRWIRREGRQDMEQQTGGTGGGVVCEKWGATFETQEELDRHIQEAHQDDDGDAEGVVSQA